MANLTIRAKGRNKLRHLLREALSVCAKYNHSEYINDFSEIRGGLLWDEDVETAAKRRTDLEASG